MKTINISNVTQVKFKQAKRMAQKLEDKDFTDNEFVQYLLDLFHGKED